MENGVNKISDIFSNCFFEIPIYQRSYSWGTDDPSNGQCAAYLSDLREHPGGDRSYFLGAVLLRSLDRNDGAYFAIVDGQQRFTTTVLFAASAVEVLSKYTKHAKLVRLLSKTFITCPASKKRKLTTVISDDAVFSAIINMPPSFPASTQTPSGQRLISARKFFTNKLEEIPEQELINIVNRLLSAQVLIYAVSDDAAATQIFELANDRGKRLSQLESLKSVLMHRLYLDSSSTSQANHDLAIVQNHFAGIFRTVEKLENIFQAPDEDAVLSTHCIAYLKWTSESWDTARIMAKSEIVKISKSPDKVKWILDFSESLEQTYHAVFNILTNGRNSKPIECLTVLGLWQGLWPLLVKTWRADNSADKINFYKIADLLERWAFLRTLGGRRSNYKVGSLEILARDFSGDFSALADALTYFINGIAGNDEFEENLRYSDFYNWEKNLARYILWRYENYLRAQPANQWSSLSWIDVRTPANSAVQYGLDHISPQDSPKNELLVAIPGDNKTGKKKFGEMYLHRLGNLVLDSRSAGAAKGNSDMSDRIYNYGKSPLLSQKELINFSTKKSNGKPDWGIKSIHKREDILVNFCKTTWKI
jgi:hypothetical protein